MSQPTDPTEPTGPDTPAVTSRVIGMARRSIGFETFTDITALPLLRQERASRGRTQLVFAGTLTETESDAIWDRMTSIDDADQAERKNLKTALDAVRAAPTLANVSRLAIINARRVLQDDET